jgi:hypothetical protein
MDTAVITLHIRPKIEKGVNILIFFKRHEGSKTNSVTRSNEVSLDTSWSADAKSLFRVSDIMMLNEIFVIPGLIKLHNTMKFVCLSTVSSQASL